MIFGGFKAWVVGTGRLHITVATKNICNTLLRNDHLNTAEFTQIISLEIEILS